jgi:hypothetical protein
MICIDKIKLFYPCIPSNHTIMPFLSNFLKYLYKYIHNLISYTCKKKFDTVCIYKLNLILCTTNKKKLIY